MAGKLVPDGLWDETGHLFPVREASPEGGRPPAGNRTVLTAILFVLKTGIAWEDRRNWVVRTRRASGGWPSGPRWVFGSKSTHGSWPGSTEPTSWTGPARCWIPAR